MPIYTATADANGDFTIPFSANYTSSQKVTVTAEKDGASKTIELFAPSDVTGGGAIQFSGSLSSFPNNIGNVILSSGISGTINTNAFNSSNTGEIWQKATGLTIQGAVTNIGVGAFLGWNAANILNLPDTLVTISDSAFQSWNSLASIVVPDSVVTIGAGAFRQTAASSCKNITIGARVTSIGTNGFLLMSACNEIILKPATPPTIQANTFGSLNSECVFKVPAASLTAYQTATNWSAFASQMIGV